MTPNTSHEPAFAGYAERVRDSFARQSFMTHLGAELTRIDPGHVEVQVPHDDRLLQQHGFFHAGVATSIADSAGGYAALSLFPESDSVLSVEFKVNLTAPGRGERLVATGDVVKSGRTLTVCEIAAYAERDGQRTLVLRGLQTLIRMADRPDEAS